MTQPLRASSGARERVLIVGAGNRDRGDDAAGLLTLELLPRPLPDSVGVAQVGDDPFVQLDRLARSDRLIAVDAVRTGAPAGTISRFDGLDALQHADDLPRGTHELGLRELLGMAQAMGSWPEKVVLFAIEGADFRLGSRPSPEVESAAREVASRIVAEIGVSPGP